MKKFEELFAELKAKAASGNQESGTVRELAKGKHFVGKCGLPPNTKAKNAPPKRSHSFCTTCR